VDFAMAALVMPKPPLVLVCLLLAAGGPASRPESLPEPAIFAPNVISTGGFESHPAFTPDGRTLYFVKSTPTFSFWTICVSRMTNGHWSQPEVAPFSGRYADADPFITRDGAHLYFISTRPLTTGGPAKDLDIWMMDRAGAGWTDPRPLSAPINSSGAEWFPTIAASGTIYFGSDRPGGQGRTDLYRARLVDGGYADAENLGPVVNGAGNEFEPFIAPDESFLIFMGARPGGRGGSDLWVTYNRAGAWTPPVALGAGVNSPASEYSPGISPDGRYFFWASARETFDTGARRLSYRELNARLTGPGNGLGDIYRIDLSALHLEMPQ
jgi:Tol biopolymer transport system component